MHFNFFGADCTWYGFWFGFGMTTSLFLLASAVVVWQLDKVAPSAWGPLSVVGWALVVAHGLNTFLSWKYFFLGPVTFGALTTALMAWGTHRKSVASTRAADAFGSV